MSNYSNLLMRGYYGAVPDPDYRKQEDPYASLMSDPMAPPAPPQMGTSPEALAYLQEQQHMPPAEEGGFLKRFARQPGMGLGLMQLGAGLASGRNWGDGIGRGFSGMADTLQKQSMIEEDRAYKQAMLAARAMGKAKDSVGTLYKFTLEDGTQVNGFMGVGADGRREARDASGNLLSPVAVEKVATEKDPGGMKSKMFVDQGQKIFQDPSSPTGWSTAARKPWEPKDPVPFDENPTQDKAPPRPGGIRLSDKDGKDLGSFQQMIMPGTKTWGVVDPRINGGNPTSLADLAKQGYATQGETGGERGRSMSTVKDVLALNDVARLHEIALDSLGNLRDNIANAPDGGQSYIQSIIAAGRTVLGDGANLSDIQRAIKARDKQASSIVGLLRKEIVGGGTMTEQDAIRVLDAIGGDPSNPTWNKTVALQLLDDIISRKKVTYKDAQKAFNTAADSIHWDDVYQPELDPGAGTRTTDRYNSTGESKPDPLGIR